MDNNVPSLVVCVGRSGFVTAVVPVSTNPHESEESVNAAVVKAAKLSLEKTANGD